MRCAVRLQSVGGCRLASYAPTHVSWLGFRPGSPSRPCAHTLKLRQRSADSVSSCNCFHAARVEVPVIRYLHLTPAASEPSEDYSLAGAGSAVLSPSLCIQVVKVGGPKTSSLRPRRARLRGDSHGGRNIGEAQRDAHAVHRIHLEAGRQLQPYVWLRGRKPI